MAVVISCFLAGCLEMYDFVIFGFLAPIINKNYLTFLDESTGIIFTYLLFAVGFLFRPVGSIIFGYIGDKLGRKKALVISISFMGFASLSLALLPTYHDIGIISCYLIALIRIVQGISLGGEYSGAAIYAIEHTNKNNKGLIGNTVLSGTTCGVLLATLVSSTLDNPIFPDYSWKFAFLLGFGLAIIGYFIRKRLGETPMFSEEKSKIKQNEIPLLIGLKNYKTQFLAGVFLSGANNANYYFFLVFVPAYLKNANINSFDFGNWYLAFFMLFLEPTFGWMSDKVGRIKMILFVCIVLALYDIVFLKLIITYGGSFSVFILLIIICAILISISVSRINITVLEIFPVSCRYSCGALSYSLGAAIFGGTTPFVCSLITKYIGDNIIYYGIYISIISLAGSVAANKLRRVIKQLADTNKGIKN